MAVVQKDVYDNDMQGLRDQLAAQKDQYDEALAAQILVQQEIQKQNDTQLQQEILKATEEGKLAGRETSIKGLSTEMITVLKTLTDGKDTRPKIPPRKPPQYKIGENFKQWFDGFLMYTNAQHLDEKYIIPLMLTFVCGLSQTRIRTLNLTDLEQEDWKTCIKQITKVISPQQTPIHAKMQLFKIKQGANEELCDYVGKLTDLADQSYGKDYSGIKDRNMLDVFVAGLKRKEIKLELIKNPQRTFRDAYSAAIDLENMYYATDEQTSDSEDIISIMQVNEPVPQAQFRVNNVCFKCLNRQPQIQPY